MTIPERPEGASYRTLIVLLDGTGDSIDNSVKMTNVGYLKTMLLGDYKDDDKQMVLYLRGIGSAADGTDFDEEATSTQKGWFFRTWEKAFATNFGDYVVEPYRWLSQNYKDGDKICIFGFSRGAYTARVLCGMINALGLIPKEKADLKGTKAAFALYNNFANLPPPWKASKEEREAEWLRLQAKFEEFKIKEECREVFIEFLGCWDTVNSVGYIRAIKLGFTRTNDIVRTFRHALSLDEHRVRFKQNNWSGAPVTVPKPSDRPHERVPRVITDAEEVWFCGYHRDVGGGFIPNATRPNLAHIPLRWMIRECFKADTGIIFHDDAIKLIGIDPSSLYHKAKPRSIPNSPSGSGTITVVEPRTWKEYFKSWIPKFPWSSTPPKPKTRLEIPTQMEDELDALDALAPAYDQLLFNAKTWGWMEYLPLRKDKLGKDGVWDEVREMHKGRGRTIPPVHVQHGGKIKAHYTVRLRMESTFGSGPKKGERYVPLARVGYAERYEDKIMFDHAVASSMVEWVA